MGCCAAGGPAAKASGRVSTGVWRAAGAAQRHALPLWIGAAALTATGRVLGDVHWCAAGAVVQCVGGFRFFVNSNLNLKP